MSSQEAQGRVQWFFSRLSCMTPAEVLYRAGHSLRGRLGRLTGRAAVAAELPQRLIGGTHWISKTGDGLPAAAPYVAEALLIETGSVRLFASSRFDVGARPQWNRCPLTGTVAPSWPSHAMSLTDRNLVGDIKYVWELNRHLHLVAIAQAWALTGDGRHLRSLQLQLGSWLEQCPCGTGPNWTSSLELALRLLNWAVIWELIGGIGSPLFEGAEGLALQGWWLASINQHVRTIDGNYSRHSSANNHLLGELAGVYVAAHTWPYWDSFGGLRIKARRELEHEFQAQVCADGVLREQAFEYATFVFDFFLAVERCAASAGEPVSPASLQRMHSMCRFMAAMTTKQGAVPMVGDADGAEAFRLDPRPGRDPVAAMLAKGAWLFGEPALGELSSGAEPRDDVKWLMASNRVPVEHPVSLSEDYPEGGYFLFGNDWGTANEVKGFVDAGAVGYLGIAAHGHADALQVWLSIGGVPLLVDPGTYSYRADKKWRDYFRGTSAHNTIRIDGKDQSVSGGRFMWTRKARVHDVNVSRAEGGGFELEAWHDGYTRLPGRHTHSRSVKYAPTERQLIVRDEVAGTASAAVELFWHVAPGWQVGREGATVVMTMGTYRAEMKFQSEADARIELISGQEEDEPLGWYSTTYGEKLPCTTIRWTAQGENVGVVTMFDIGGFDNTQPPPADTGGNGLEALLLSV
nr:alginate lyase family protein [uncultured Roseateles sp.]